MAKKALITGITGQDGSYLAELLLSKGYEVHGIIRRSSSFNTARIESIYQDPHEPQTRLKLVYADLNDASSLNRILRTVRPDEIYNPGAHPRRDAGQAVPRQPRRQARLGVRRRLCRGDVADAPDRQPRGLRDRDRRVAHRARVPRPGLRPSRPRLEEVRGDRPALFPPR